jgi:hypothetical protein
VIATGFGEQLPAARGTGARDRERPSPPPFDGRPVVHRGRLVDGADDIEKPAYQRRAAMAEGERTKRGAARQADSGDDIDMPQFLRRGAD